MTAFSKAFHIYKLDDIADESNNTHSTTIKLKIKLNFKTGAGTEYGNDSNAKKAKF